ncbi:MAG: hypothetical protein IKV45_03325 [Firmicutes bacterium]|nr:hypothetical protein [Bacillota bacterium]
MRPLLLEVLSHRKDRIALDIIREHPELIDDTVIRLALENGCVRVIRYLREHDLITAEGGTKRQQELESNCQKLMDELDKKLPDIEKFFK